MLGRRGFALESAAAKICREAGGRVATNLFVRDLDVNVPNLIDNRQLEVVADGLPLFAGPAQAEAKKDKVRVLFLLFFETVAAWQHCIDDNTTCKTV